MNPNIRLDGTTYSPLCLAIVTLHSAGRHIAWNDAPLEGGLKALIKQLFGQLTRHLNAGDPNGAAAIKAPAKAPAELWLWFPNLMTAERQLGTIRSTVLLQLL